MHACPRPGGDYDSARVRVDQARVRDDERVVPDTADRLSHVRAPAGADARRRGTPGVPGGTTAAWRTLAEPRAAAAVAAISAQSPWGAGAARAAPSPIEAPRSATAA